MIFLQEELDWLCYSLFGVSDEAVTFNVVENEYIELWFGQRAFEIILARKMAAGKLESNWFHRHGSSPITEIPIHWPENYKKIVEKRIKIIKEDKR